MKPSTQRGIVIAVVAVVVIGIIAWRVVTRLARTREHTIDGTIVALDVAQRTATIEFIHPKSGLPGQVGGTIPQDCPVYINDELAPHGLADLRVGDKGAVRGTIHADQSIEAQWVRIRRPAAASQPAGVTRPAGTAPPATASAAATASPPAASQPANAPPPAERP